MAASAHIVDLVPTETGAPLAILLKAASDELRLNILRVLAQDSFSVSELCTIFDLRQSALSHHLKILIDAGLLNRRKEGTAIFYRRALAEGPLQQLQEQILEHIDATPITRHNSLGIERVQRQRHARAPPEEARAVHRFRTGHRLLPCCSDRSLLLAVPPAPRVHGPGHAHALLLVPFGEEHGDGGPPLRQQADLRQPL